MTNDFDESILRSLRRISRAIDLYSRKLGSIYNLTGPQLVCLREISQTRGISSGDLAKAVSLSGATVTGILDRLEKRRLISRRRDRKDRRKVIVRITEEGRTLAESAPIPLQQVFIKRLNAIPEQQQAALNSMLMKIVEMMEAEELDAAPVLAAGPVTAMADEVLDFLDKDNPERSDNDSDSS